MKKKLDKKIISQKKRIPKNSFFIFYCDFNFPIRIASFQD